MSLNLAGKELENATVIFNLKEQVRNLEREVHNPALIPALVLVPIMPLAVDQKLA